VSKRIAADSASEVIRCIRSKRPLKGYRQLRTSLVAALARRYWLRDVVASPPDQECIDDVIIEAYAAGRLGVRATGVTDAFFDEDTDPLVPPQNVAVLAAVVSACSGTQLPRERRVKAGESHAAPKVWPEDLSARSGPSFGVRQEHSPRRFSRSPAIDLRPCPRVRRWKAPVHDSSCCAWGATDRPKSVCCG
jgi:hypothetical protein